MVDSNSGTNMTGVTGYLLTQLLPTLPDTNQGFEIRDFELGVEMNDSGGGAMTTPNYLLDGVAFFECKQSVSARNSSTSGSSMTVSRSLIRGASSSFSPTEPLVEVEVTDESNPGVTSSLTFTFDSVDIRPSGTNCLSSAVVFRAWDTDHDDQDSITARMRNVKITGQSTLTPIPGPSNQRFFEGAGVEAGIKDGSVGRFILENVLIRDAWGEGFYGLVSKDFSSGFFSATTTSMLANGAVMNNPPFIQLLGFASADFDESGLHLEVSEGGSWTVDEGRVSHFSNNYRHGVLLESGSEPDETDGFPLAEFVLCTFMRNGLGLSFGQGHGISVYTRDTITALEVSQSALSGNRSCGVQMLFDSAETVRGQRLQITNSTISGNLGLGAAFMNGAFPIDTNPVSVVSLDESNGLSVRLSQATITDNATPYAVALYGVTTGAQDALWPPGSTSSSVDHCVLKENGFIPSGGGFSDQAFYPEPLTPFGLGQWQDIFDRTAFSNLGNELGSGTVPAYGTAQGNFYADPLLVPFTFLGNALGAVFPSATSPLIDAGGASRVATEATDNRGPGFPRLLGLIWDVGAFEIQ